MKICPNCGTQLNDEVKFCTECGYTFTAAAAAAAQQIPAQEIPAQPPVQQYAAPQQPVMQPPVQQYNPAQQLYAPVQPPKKDNTKTIIIIAVVAILLIAGVVGGLIWWFNRDTDDEDSGKKEKATTEQVSEDETEEETEEETEKVTERPTERPTERETEPVEYSEGDVDSVAKKAGKAYAEFDAETISKLTHPAIRDAFEAEGMSIDELYNSGFDELKGMGIDSLGYSVGNATVYQDDSNFNAFKSRYEDEGANMDGITAVAYSDLTLSVLGQEVEIDVITVKDGGVWYLWFIGTEDDA